MLFMTIAAILFIIRSSCRSCQHILGVKFVSAVGKYTKKKFERQNAAKRNILLTEWEIIGTAGVF